MTIPPIINPLGKDLPEVAVVASGIAEGGTALSVGVVGGWIKLLGVSGFIFVSCDKSVGAGSMAAGGVAGKGEAVVSPKGGLF